MANLLLCTAHNLFAAVVPLACTPGLKTYNELGRVSDTSELVQCVRTPHLAPPKPTTTHTRWLSFCLCYFAPACLLPLHIQHHYHCHPSMAIHLTLGFVVVRTCDCSAPCLLLTLRIISISPVFLLVHFLFPSPRYYRPPIFGTAQPTTMTSLTDDPIPSPTRPSADSLQFPGAEVAI